MAPSQDGHTGGVVLHRPDARRVLLHPPFANLRDVGGYPLRDGGTTSWRALLRSDLPPDLNEHDIAPLLELGLRRVVDLRDDDEVSETPSPFAAAGVPVVRRPIFEGAAASFVADGISLHHLYTHMLTARGVMLTAAVRAVAAGPGPVLVHCSAGKDRTGLVVALALTAVGVERSTVLDDYALTASLLRGAWLERRLADLQARHGLDLRDRVELLAGSPAEALATALEFVAARWGSVTGFLHANGLSTDELGALRTALAPGTKAARAATSAG